MTQETLDAMRAALPYGAQKKISQKLKYSQEYVGAVLRGTVPENIHIISEAQKLIRKNQELKERVLSKVRESLNNED